MAFEELKERQAKIWGAAPFEKVAGTIHDMHDDLVARLEPQGRERWADVACGTGEVAFRATRAGADVTGSDLAPVLIETAKTIAASEGLDLRLEVADCENLPYEDATFDVVSSSVGVIFAPDHARVASELARVCRPGGRLGITAWRGASGVGDLFRAMAPFAPPLPQGAGSPFQWGDEAYVEKMLGEWFDIRFHEGNSRYEGDDAGEMWTFFRDHYGPTFTVWSSLDEERRAELNQAMVDLLEESREGDLIAQDRHYIVAIATRR
jgi:SAM-dependent methyltransferase